MKKFSPLAGVGILSTLLVATLAAQKTPVEYPITPVPLSQVTITGGFWAAKLETNRTVTIPAIMRQNETTGRVDNLRKGAGLMTGEYVSRRFNDTDVYKVIEAAAYTLVSHPDPVLQKELDSLIEIIGKAQQPDGYLFPARTINPQKPAPGVGTERWMYENTGSHETYNSGHLYEAAVAHFQATGERNLLDIAIKNANLVRATFGPTARQDAPGHEEIELALVRLYGVTKDVRYFDLAKFFLDERGVHGNVSQNYTEQSWQLYNDRAYRQDDVPLVDQTRGQGHAVRATYAYNAMTDVAAMLHDPAYDKAVERLWQDVTSKRIYLTGGLGSVGGTEAFGDDYALPNRTAYTETCASVGAILWGHRMFLKSGESKYLDAFEQTLYNGLLSGVSIQGDTFFYQNPLESNGRRGGRVAYPDVACCPANLARLVAQLPGLIYAQRESEVFVNLFIDSEATVNVGGGTAHIKQTTNYPWDGKVAFAITADKPMTFTLKLRVPGWLDKAPFGTDLYTYTSAVTESVQVVSFDAAHTAKPGQPWMDVNIPITAAAATRGAVVPIRVTLPMPVRRVVAHAGVKDDAGKSAIQRGPVVYALEGVDNGGKVLDVSVPLDAVFTPALKADVLGGVTTLTANVPVTGADGEKTMRAVTAVPYFAWANRGRGEMVVWIRY